MADIGRVLPVDIELEMRRSYIDYAMSVIVTRALPDVRDGLKPVHRRILYAMHDLNNTPSQPYKKSARVVGEVLGRYHPHGETAVYDSMVRMAQDFSLRYPLVDGHGNFGSQDGDPPAAMRYTEVRLSHVAMEMVADIEKDTVQFNPNFDEDTTEPEILPARIPNLLVNGAAGIAVAMATNIPPHNLNEVADAVIYLVDHPGASVDELMRKVPGPDFPTGGFVMGQEGIRQAYTSGRGIITLRGVAEAEETPAGRLRIVITDVPYQVNKARMVERIAELVHEHRIEGVADLRDESDRHGIRVVLDLRRDAKPKVILNQLYKYTALQQTFGIIMLALVGGRPMVLSLGEALQYYIDHRKEVIVRRTRYELSRAEARAHILEGLRIALNHLDAVIALIRGSADVESARNGLMSQFGLSEKQAQAILDMRLQRLTALERDKIEAEYQELMAEIARLKAILDDEKLVLALIKDDLADVKKRYGDRRRTQIMGAAAELQDDDLIPEESTVVTITHRGYVKRQPLALYRAQRRGGRGITGSSLREDDFVEQLFTASTHDYLCFFTNRGRVYRLKVHELPEASRQAKGTAVVNLLSLDADERVTAVQTLTPRNPDQYWIFATMRGVVKRTAVSVFQSWRGTGLQAISLTDDDELIAVVPCRTTDDLLLATSEGQVIRFPVTEVRAMGRQARGVAGVRLRKKDRVVSLAATDGQGDLLLVSANGFGKRSPIRQFRRTRRGGQGIIGLRRTERTGPLVNITPVAGDEEIMLISAEGTMIRMPVSGISVQGRQSQGVTVMRLADDHQVGAVAVVRDEPIEPAE
jgi:DNA gyrase subunit A